MNDHNSHYIILWLRWMHSTREMIITREENKIELISFLFYFLLIRRILYFTYTKHTTEKKDWNLIRFDIYKPRKIIK